MCGENVKEMSKLAIFSILYVLCCLVCLCDQPKSIEKHLKVTKSEKVFCQFGDVWLLATLATMASIA